MNFKVHGLINYNTLVVQAMEMGGIGNITINATICKLPAWDKI